MADKEDDVGEPAPKRVYFGSLEEVERQRLLKAGEDNGAGSMSAEIKAGIEAGNINVSAGKLHCTHCTHLGRYPWQSEMACDSLWCSRHTAHAHTHSRARRHAQHSTLFLTIAETMERSSYANVAEQHKKELLDIFEARKKVS